jgi:hypothetical protein
MYIYKYMYMNMHAHAHTLTHIDMQTSKFYNCHNSKTKV